MNRLNRLIPTALALLPGLMTGAAQAQSVSDEVNMQLWCGTAMMVAFSNPPPDVGEDELAEAEDYIARGAALIELAIKAHLDAGFTQEAADKIKADLVPVVSEQVLGSGEDALYSFEECLEILPPADGA
jgi:hypothetical protein